MITDSLFKEMQLADPEKTKSFILRFLEYIQESRHKDTLKLAIDKKDPRILLDLMYGLPKEELDRELPHIIATGRFIYLLKVWNK
jgi:hypothetical protein